MRVPRDRGRGFLYCPAIGQIRQFFLSERNRMGVPSSAAWSQRNFGASSKLGVSEADRVAVVVGDGARRTPAAGTVIVTSTAFKQHYQKRPRGNGNAVNQEFPSAHLANGRAARQSIYGGVAQ